MSKASGKVTYPGTTQSTSISTFQLGSINLATSTKVQAGLSFAKYSPCARAAFLQVEMSASMTRVRITFSSEPSLLNRLSHNCEIEPSPLTETTRIPTLIVSVRRNGGSASYAMRLSMRIALEAHCS
jgi:hypothetical protein